MVKRVERLLLFFVCLGFFSRPAEAYWIGSVFYSEGVGASYTELDSYDWYYGAFDSYVNSTLYFNATPVDNAEAYDYSLAVADVYGSSGPGVYEIDGEHWIAYYDLGWVYVDDSYATFDDSGSGGGDCCGGSGGSTPTCEVSVYTGSWPGNANDEYGAQFIADLGFTEDYGCYTPLDMTFFPGGVLEDIEGIGSGCTDPVTSRRFAPDIADNDWWDVCEDSSYGCDVTDKMYYDRDSVDRLQDSIATGWQGVCWMWYGSQAMSYLGTYYQTNDVGIWLDGANGTGYRDNASGSIY